MTVKTSAIYSDLDLRLVPHPLTGDIVVKENNEAIKQSLRNLFYLEAFDIPFDGDKKSGLKESLFEQINQLTTSALRTRLEWLITRLEPRVILHEVSVTESEGHDIDIKVYYTIKSLMSEGSFEFTVSRVR